MADREVWVFDAEGGCESCGAVAGEYEVKPGRPHPNCDCSITHVKISEICITVGEIELDRELLNEIAEALYPADETWGTQYWVWQQWLISVLVEKDCCEVRNGKMTNNCGPKFEGKERIEWVEVGIVENWRGQGLPAGWDSDG